MRPSMAINLLLTNKTNMEEVKMEGTRYRAAYGIVGDLPTISRYTHRTREAAINFVLNSFGAERVRRLAILTEVNGVVESTEEVTV